MLNEQKMVENKAKTIRFSVLLFLFFSMQLHAQFKVSGKITDQTNGVALSNVEIVDVVSKNTVVSTENGSFTIETFGTLEISRDGYLSKIIVVTGSENLRIALIPATNNLDAVIINAQTIPKTRQTATETISIVTKSEIESENTVALAPILNRVPGVFMQSGTLSTNRITIRGIGARSPFATAKIRAYFGDIPLTDGNGESAIEDLELASIAKMEIQKGPSSSSYGVGLGGTILLAPEFAAFNTTKAQLFTTAGNYGLWKTVASIAHGGKNASVNFVYSNTQTDGYRENNALDRATATLTANWFLNRSNELTFIGNYSTLKAFIPSSLNRTDFENNPQNAATIWKNARGFEDAKNVLAGINWTHTFNENIQQKTSIFSSSRNNYEPRPFNILEEQSNAYGVRTRTLLTQNFSNSSLKWSLGGEFFFDDYNAKQFENLYNDFPQGTGSVAGNIISNIDEQRSYVNLFAEAIYQYKKWTLNAGIHFNKTNYKVSDVLMTNPTTEKFTFNGIFSPKIGVNYRFSENNSFYISAAHGFSPPTTAETLLPEGVFNPNIKPSRGWNYEAGCNFKTNNQKLSGNIAIYHMLVSDLPVNRRTETDQNITINAGKTTHNGIELAATYAIYQKGKFSLQIYGNASINNFKFDDFVTSEANFSGNALTGVPKSVVNLGIETFSKRGLYGRLDFQAVGKMPANDSNSVFSDAYELLNGKIGYKNQLGSRLHYDLSFGMQNIFNEKYASQLQVNAFGNDSTARYFYPGLPLNSYGSMQFKYIF